MKNIINLIILNDGYLLYLLKYILVGIINKKGNEVNAKGILIGIWRFQLQLTFGYSNQKEDIGETGYA